MKDNEYTFKRISLQQFAEIKYNSDFPSSLVDWLLEWYAIFNKKQDNVLGYNKDLYLIASYREGKILAILPLVCVTRRYFGLFSVRFLEFLGQQWSSFGNDLIIVEKIEKDFFLQLKKWIKQNISYNFLFLKFMPRESIIERNCRFYSHGGAPAINLSNYEDYNQYAKHNYSRNLKQNLRKALNKTKKNNIQIQESVEEINDSNFKEIKRISKSKLLDNKGFVYGDKEKENFYRFVYQKFDSNVVFVKFNGVAVSYRTNIFLNGNKYCVDAAFDRNYRKYNLGIWNVDASIKDSFSRGIKIHSMGPGLDSYKFKFANAFNNYFMCVDWKLSFKSLVLIPYFFYLLRRKNSSVKQELQGFGF